MAVWEKEKRVERIRDNKVNTSSFRSTPLLRLYHNCVEAPGLYYACGLITSLPPRQVLVKSCFVSPHIQPFTESKVIIPA